MEKKDRTVKAIEPNAFYRIMEVADLLNCSNAQVYSLVQKKLIPARRFGKSFKLIYGQDLLDSAKYVTSEDDVRSRLKEKEPLDEIERKVYRDTLEKILDLISTSGTSEKNPPDYLGFQRGLKEYLANQ